MLKDGPLLAPDRIGTDGAGTYPGAIAAARKEGRLARDPVHHVTKHLQQGIESDHFRLKKNMPRVGGFRSFNTARRSIQGFEAMLWMRKGFGFAGPWTVVEQNQMLRLCLDFRRLTEGKFGQSEPNLQLIQELATSPSRERAISARTVGVVRALGWIACIRPSLQMPGLQPARTAKHVPRSPNGPDPNNVPLSDN